MDATHTETTTAPLLAAGLGRLARRRGRPLHLAVAAALAEYPGLSAADVRRGWYAERADQLADE